MTDLQEQINTLRQELVSINTKMQKIYSLCVYGQNATCSPELFIPYGKEWTAESPTRYTLEIPDDTPERRIKQQITVQASTTYQNSSLWTPNWLFNGKKENEVSGQYGWSSDSVKPSYLIVIFKEPVDANILVITSGSASNLICSPSSFEIWGSKNSFDFTFLGGFIDVTWKPSQQKFFSFDNIDFYNAYKIVFKQTLDESNTTCIAFSGLNLGKLEI